MSHGNAAAFARSADVAIVTRILQQHRTLYDAALQMPRVLDLHGRGITPVVEVEGERCVVRHYRRGGSVASALGDRYLRFAGNRVLQELHASEAARARGVATPSVRFGASYDHGWFRRYDIATSFVPNARDLSDILFDEAAREPAVEQAYELLRNIVHQGVMHYDLNLKNILVTDERAYVLDLDRARVVDGLTGTQAEAMRSRFMRSLTKWERRHEREVPPRIRTRLGEAFVA